jgi:hypothetical protein
MVAIDNEVTTKQMAVKPFDYDGSEAHLRRILGAYAAYYNESRTHHSLNKDAPFHRAIERRGTITSHSILGGLHHQYCRI